MSQLRFTLEELRESREEARLASPGITSLQQAQADIELKNLPFNIRKFLHELVPIQRVCIVLGIDHLNELKDFYPVLNPDERLAVYLGKGHLSWMPLALTNFQRMFEGSSENLIPIVYDYVNNRLLNKSLDDLPGNRMHREALETRVQRIPRREKTALERSFFTQIEDSYGTYERLAQLDAGVLVDRIYEAITSS